jgi:transposase
MGQLLLPIFPVDTQMITMTLGVREYDGTVYYLHSGMPIFSHESGDLNKFRYITSNLILHGLCTNQDIADTFHVSTDSVRRWKKKLSEEGDGAFFKEESRHGRSHKLLPQVLGRIQSKLDQGRSAYSIAKEEGLSEGSIRYAISLGRLKKNPGLR